MWMIRPAVIAMTITGALMLAATARADWIVTYQGQSLGPFQSQQDASTYAQPVGGTVQQIVAPSALAKLDPNDNSKADVISLPPGTATVNFARMASTSGCPCTYQSVPAGSLPMQYTPPADQPVVDVEALNSSGQQLGTWFSATAGGKLIATTPPAPAPAPATDPPPPTPSMAVGVNAGCYGTTGATEQRQLGSVVRFNTGLSDTCFTTLKNAGLKFDVNVTGPYTSSGVSGLNRSSWVSSATSWYQAHCGPALCPYFEVLNEPYGTWFWGSSADSQANADAYADLVKRTYSAFHTIYGSSAPLILADCSNQSWTNNWCSEWTGSSAYPNALGSTDAVVVHAYDGEAHKTAATAGNRNLVSGVHAQTGKPVAVTEVGWETGSDCDSGSTLYTEQEQADNVTSFSDWARGTGYVSMATFFTYHDFGSSPVCGYGVVRSNGTHKLAYAALQAEASH